MIYFKLQNCSITSLFVRIFSKNIDFMVAFLFKSIFKLSQILLNFLNFKYAFHFFVMQICFCQKFYFLLSETILLNFFHLKRSKSIFTLHIPVIPVFQSQSNFVQFTVFRWKTSLTILRVLNYPTNTVCV